MESSSEIELPKPSYHFIHVTPIDTVSTAAPKNYEYAHNDSHMGPSEAMSRIKKLEDLNDDDQGESVHNWSESVYFQEFLALSASKPSDGELSRHHLPHVRSMVLCLLSTLCCHMMSA